MPASKIFFIDTPSSGGPSSYRTTGQKCTIDE
jgi:hypothetical protein